MRQMIDSNELRRNGPYLRVILPDVLPPDWTSLARDLELELDEGVETATLVTPHIDAVSGDLDRLLQLSSMLIRRGVRVRLELREDASLLRT
jgi:hypothetical protein